MQPSLKKSYPPSRISAWTVVGLLAGAALVASWVDMIVIAADSSDLVMDLHAPKSPLYYFVHAIAIMAVMAAGLLAAIVGRLRVVGIAGRIAFLALALSVILWTTVTYGVEELFSRAIFGPTGPFVWFTLIFVLAGTNRRAWEVIEPVIRFLAYGTSGLAIWTIVSSKGSAYFSNQLSKPTQYSILLMWLGGWTLLSATRLHGWRFAVRVIPYFSFLLIAIYSQARSWTVLAVLLGIVFVILRAREQRSLLSAARILGVSCALIAVVGGLTYGIFLRSALQGLAGRVDEDSRTGEYVAFFSDVRASDMLIGKGPNGTWYWPEAREDVQFADNGFIWMTFIGGLPTLLSYVVLMIWPAIRALRMDPHGPDAAAVVLLLFWAVALMGLSTYTAPSVSMSSYLISLCAGRCHLFVFEKAGLQRKRSLGSVSARTDLQGGQGMSASNQNIFPVQS